MDLKQSETQRKKEALITDGYLYRDDIEEDDDDDDVDTDDNFHVGN